MSEDRFQMIEKKIEEFSNFETFTLQNLLDALPRPEKTEDQKKQEEQVERALTMDDRFFFDIAKEHFYPRRKFFHHAEFVLTPSEYEIENGILFPGHRFVPFCQEDVFPSEVTFRECGGPNLKMRQVTLKIAELIQYHLLMGTEQIGDFLIAEDPEHDIHSENSTPDTQVTLHVFDMKKIYAANHFQQGDILVARVLDWDKGVFDFTCETGRNRSETTIRAWVDEYSLALENVIDDYDNYFDLPEYLAWGFFYGGKRLFGSHGASLDEFYRLMERVEIHFEQGQSTLAKAEEDVDYNASENEDGIPEQIRISSGVTDSIEGIMAELGTPMTMNELDAYMLDNCYNRELEFSDLYARCFGDQHLNFADEAQEAVFLNYLEDRWEDVVSRYNRAEDETKAPVRERILELTTERLEWLHSLADLQVSQTNLPEADLKKLAELAKHLDGILGSLNSEKNALQEDEAEKMLDMVDRSAEIQSELIETMNQYMNKP